jgi:glutaconate CoA-transferase subunit B
MTDSEASLVSEPVPVGPRGEYRPRVEGWLPFRRVFDLLWSGRRHAMTMPTQIDRFGNTNISFIGDPDRPKVQLLGARGIPGNTINHTCSFFVAGHSPRSFVERVDMASSVGYDPDRWQDGVKRDFHEIRRVVTDLAVLDFSGADHAMCIRSLHPGVSVDQVRGQTSFPLLVADDLAETRAPTGEELRILQELDPHNQRATVFKS